MTWPLISWAGVSCMASVAATVERKCRRCVMVCWDEWGALLLSMYVVGGGLLGRHDEDVVDAYVGRACDDEFDC